MIWYYAMQLDENKYIFVMNDKDIRKVKVQKYDTKPVPFDTVRCVWARKTSQLPIYIASN
jgi:hypothetical protein